MGTYSLIPRKRYCGYYSEQTSLGEILHRKLLNIFYKNIEAEPGYTDLHHTVSLQLHQLPWKIMQSSKQFKSRHSCISIKGNSGQAIIIVLQSGASY